MAELNYWQEIGLHPLWVQRENSPFRNANEILSLEEQGSIQVQAALSEAILTPEIRAHNGHTGSSDASGVSDQASSNAHQESLQDIGHLETFTENQEGFAAPMAVTDPFDVSAQPISVEWMDWPALEEAIHACRACSLGCTRTHAVPGVGPKEAPWMFIGEAPGAEEDRLGQPFVGQAGKLLDAMLSSIGLSRKENVYIANVLKCRPPNNRKPEAEEVAACVAFLHRQLALVQPKILIALGATAAQALLNTDVPIGRLRGVVHQYQGRPLIATYHPSYLLRTPSDKAKAWADLCLARRIIATAGNGIE